MVVAAAVRCRVGAVLREAAGAADRRKSASPKPDSSVDRKTTLLKQSVAAPRCDRHRRRAASSNAKEEENERGSETGSSILKKSCGLERM